MTVRMPNSFRLRLVIAFVALFAAMSVAVSFAGLILRERQMRSLFDKELMTRATDLIATVHRQPRIDAAAVSRVSSDLSDQIYFRDFFVEAWDDAGNSIQRSSNLRNIDLPLDNARKGATGDEGIVDQWAPRGLSMVGNSPTLRGVRMRFAGDDGHAYLVAVMTDPIFVTDSVSSLRWLFVGGNIGALIAACGAAWLVTGAMSRRLETIKQQVQRVGPEDLDLRIDARDNDEISELVGHVNAMLDRLKAGFETQERFIHDASHELKTPVATVQAEAQAMLLGEATQDELLAFVHNTNDEMRRLGRLAESLLLLTRKSESHIVRRFQPAELSEITISALRHLSALATDHQVHLHLDNISAEDSTVIRCDADLLESMISNLVRNAIRFSPRNQDVRIALRHDAGYATVTVEDEGPGIPQDVLPHIFNRFFASSQNKVRRGAGVGLAIASTVAQLHGGKISAANKSTTGAIFTITLPISVSMGQASN